MPAQPSNSKPQSTETPQAPQTSNLPTLQISKQNSRTPCKQSPQTRNHTYLNVQQAPKPRPLAVSIPFWVKALSWHRSRCPRPRSLSFAPGYMHFVYMYTCMQLCIYIYTFHIYIYRERERHIHLYIYTCICICIYIHMYEVIFSCPFVRVSCDV